MSWLYRYEAKGIQSWIMATDALQDLRGGSARIEELGGLVRSMAEPLGGKPLMVAAGGGTWCFEDRANLSTFAANLPMVLHRALPGLHIIHAWVEQSGVASQDTQALQQRLADARNRPFVDLPEAGPWTERAARTGLPAIHRGKSGLVDAATRARLNTSDQNAVGPEVHLRNPAYGGDPDWLFETDLHSPVWGEVPMAVVHADGNAIGERVISMKSKQLSEFSELLTSASRRAACEAVQVLETRLKEQSGTDVAPRSLPARPIVIGGDDFTFIVRGDQAIPFTVAWIDAFERYTGEHKLTACAGIAFVRIGFPFSQAHDIAEEACKVAKKRLKGLDLSSRVSALAFTRVTTSLVEADACSMVYALRGCPGLNSLAQLRAVAHPSHRLPTGKLRTWLGLDGSDRPEGRALWNRIGEVATGDKKQAEQWKALLSALENAGGDFEDGGQPTKFHRALLSDALGWLRVQPMSSAQWSPNHPEFRRTDREVAP